MVKMSLERRRIREKRYDDFSKNEYHELCDLYDIEEYPNKFYKIRTKEHGQIDFYPMSDKLNFVRRGWKSDGLNWIRINLLKKNTMSLKNFMGWKYVAPLNRIIYQVKIGNWNYWIERKSGGEFALFVGATLIMKTLNMGDIDDYLKTQLSKDNDKRQK